MRRFALVVCLLPALALGEETAPVHPGWAPLLVPASLALPGLGHLFRGERQAAGRLLAAGGVAAALTVAAGLFLLLTGGSDVSGAVGIPIAMLGISTLVTLGVTDVVGTFCSGPAPPLADTWSARVRLALTLIAPMHHDAEPAPEALASWRSARWLVEGRAGLPLSGPSGPWLQGTVGVKVLGYTDAEPRAGLWLEAGARGSTIASSATLRSRARLVSTVPMGIFGERFSRLTSVLRLGVDPTWTWYGGGTRPASFEVGLSGGFEVRFVASQALRLVLGYEHARDEVTGGAATGFLGVFHAGLELALTPQLMLVGAGHLGAPNAFTAGIEWRP